MKKFKFDTWSMLIGLAVGVMFGAQIKDLVSGLK